MWRHKINRRRVSLILNLVLLLNVRVLSVLRLVALALAFALTLSFLAGLLLILSLASVDIGVELRGLLLDLAAGDFLVIIFGLFLVVLDDAAALGMERELRAADELVALVLCHFIDVQLFAGLVHLGEVVFMTVRDA